MAEHLITRYISVIHPGYQAISPDSFILVYMTVTYCQLLNQARKKQAWPVTGIADLTFFLDSNQPVKNQCARINRPQQRVVLHDENTHQVEPGHEP